MTDDYLFGNAALHGRFFAITEILAKLVSRAPAAVALSRLETDTGRSGRELLRLCNALERAELVRRDPEDPSRWQLAADPSSVTLEDVFRCMVEQQARPRPGARAAERASHDVDLLVTQAMIAINQSVFKQLRQFSLDRLKASAAGMFPLGYHATGTVRCFDEDFDSLHAGAVQDLPVHAAA